MRILRCCLVLSRSQPHSLSVRVSAFDRTTFGDSKRLSCPHMELARKLSELLCRSSVTHYYQGWACYCLGRVLKNIIDSWLSVILIVEIILRRSRFQSLQLWDIHYEASSLRVSGEFVVVSERLVRPRSPCLLFLWRPPSTLDLCAVFLATRGLENIAARQA